MDESQDEKAFKYIMRRAESSTSEPAHHQALAEALKARAINRLADQLERIIDIIAIEIANHAPAHSKNR